MRTIEATATVSSKGNLLVHVSDDIPRGEHKVVLVLDDMPTVSSRSCGMTVPLLRVGSWPRDLSVRREELYGDDGR